MDIKNIRKDFPILNRKIGDQNLVYLDNAATTQKPNTVIEALTSFYTNYNANIHRSVYTLGNEAENIYYSSKITLKDFLNARYSEEIIFSSGTTQSLNDISRMIEPEIKAGDEIVLSIAEHHANLVPWQELAKRTNAKLIFLNVNVDGYISLDELKSVINEKTKVVTIAYASNVLGTINPVIEIGELIKNYNIYYVIDAAQAAPHINIDVQKINCDFLVFSGHKICAPTGIGVLYGKKNILDKLNPVSFGGGMISIVEDSYSTWADIPNKFEAGTPLLGQAAGLEAAIKYIENIGISNIEKYTKELTNYLIKNLSKIPGIEIYGPKNVEDRVSLVSFNLKNVHPHDVASFLDSKGICVRAGHQCTQPLLRKLGCNSVVRVSIYFYNTFEEIDLFIKTLEATKEFFDDELF